MPYYSFYKEYFPFWNSLSEDDRKKLCENTTEEFFEKEQPLHGNMQCSGLYIVQTGRLRIYILSEDGKEITLYRLNPGDFCMLSASCVLQSITFEVFVEAEAPGTCYRISASAFGDLTERYPQVKIFALETAVERFSDVMWVMQQILFMSMDKRLAIFLLEESQMTKSDTVSLTHDRIARHLGTAREVVSRVLKHLSADGIIDASRKEITIIDKKRLQKIAY